MLTGSHSCRRGWFIYSGIILAVLCGTSSVYAARNVNIDLRNESARAMTVKALAREANARKLDAESMAVRKGWTRRGQTAKGQVFELVALKADGSPIYYQTQNGSAAISTAANLVRNTAPYSVSGTNLIVGVWDGGAVRSDHQEFSTGSRVTVQDGCSAADHATHVGGTIGAAGVDSNAEGMAPGVAISSYDWNSDQSEMASDAATGQNQTSKIYVSNHSYGYTCGWQTGSYSGNYGPHWFGYQLSDREDRGFGQYSYDVRSWDAICYDAPYYLPFKAAGNDRNDTAPSDGTTFYYYSSGSWQSKTYSSAGDPYSDNHDSGGFDTIGYIGVAKNVMTVGAVNDAVDSGSRNTANATMASFSCWGPTDDGRVKPDIVANGVYVYSSLSGSTSSYGYMSGTSMATPNAAGSAMLIMDYYRSLFPTQYMRASMLKALIIHTADDLGNTGPDYQNGWGLMNTKAACDTISNHYAAVGAGLMIDDTVNNSTTSNTYTFTWDNSSPIRVTLCWTDPEGAAQSGLNSTTANLVNDLDLRIVGPDGTTNFPYKLDRSNPGNTATQADNSVDNVEQVYIADPSGQGGSNFAVIVNYKGSLTDNSQTYSLVFSNVEVDESPNYGLRDDDGVNVPTVTYWCTGLGGDAVKKGTEFDGSDLGSISALYIKDAAIKTWKSGSGNVTGTSYKYKIWQDGDSEPSSYTTRAVGWSSDDGSGNQTWSDFGAEINATNGLSVGDYNWKILFEVSGTGTPGLSANGPWLATFTITPNYGNSWHIPTNSEPSSTTMRAPANPSSDQDVTFNIGTYSPGSDQSGGTLYYREAGGSWQDKALSWNMQEGDNKYWQVTITGNTFSAGASVEYCFKVIYTDDDDTYLGTTNNTGSTKYAGETAAKAAPFTFTYSSAANISVLGTNLAEIADGDVTPSTADGSDFGGVNVDGPVVTNVFTITNTGTATLNIEDVAIGGAHGADFSVAAQPDETWIEAGSSRTFTLTFDPSGTGTRSATVYITNDTSGAESEYTFAVQGGGLADPAAGSATADGSELVDLAWTKDANCDVMIVHRAGSASTAPLQDTAYSVGDACGSGTVIYKGSGAALEHVAASGQTHHYAFYSFNGNYYSDGVTDSATLDSYTSGEIVEPFACTNGATMNTVSSSGGNGFSGGWAGSTSDFTVHDGNFSEQANYPAPHGNKVTCTPASGSSISMRRSFAAISTGKVYAAVVMNYQWDGVNKWSGVSLLDDTTEKVFFGECYGGNALLGVGDTVSGTAMSAGTGNDYILIARYDFDTGAAVASAYKIGTDAVPLSEPESWNVTDSSMGTIAEIDGIMLHGGAEASSGTPGDLYFDEVRVATSWKELIKAAPDAPAVQAASETNATAFTAAWSVSSSATNYYLDVSSLSDFSGFLSGYENRLMGNVISGSVTGLSESTAYYYRLRAQNAYGTSGYSDTQEVTTVTPVIIPSINAPTKTDIGCTSATLGATLQDNGGATVTNYGIIWAASSTPTMADHVIQKSSSEPSMPDVFTLSADGLPDGTTIYYRGYAMNVNGTGYSGIDSFDTPALPQGANPDSANAVTAYLGDAVTINAKSWQNFDTTNARSWAQIYGRWDNADLMSGTTTGAGRDPGNSADELYANTPQFTQSGTFYWAMLIRYQSGNDFYYWQNNASWHKLSENPPDTAVQSIVVSVIPTPSDQTATRSTASPDSAIDLGWSRNSFPHDVLIVRKTAAQSWTEPTDSTAYNADDNIGDGVVVYRGSATNLSDTGLSSGTTYDYKFYSENHSYYSAGVTAQASTRGAVSAVWDGETGGNMTLGANWNPDGAPATGTDVNLYFFSGATRYDVTNDFAVSSDFGGLFFNSDAAYTLAGNAFRLYEKLENSNSATVTVSADITLNGDSKTEVNPVNGDLVLSGTVDTAGKNLEIYGNNSKVLQLNGAVSGSGDLYVKQKSLVKLGAASSYGDTYIEAGEFWVNEGGSAGSSANTITVGGSDGNVVTKLWIGDMDGGTTVSQQLAVTSGTGTNRVVGGLHAAGTNTYSGNISVTDAMELYAVAGGTLVVGGIISGGDAIVGKSGEGTVRLTGANTFTGPFYLNAGTVTVANAGVPLRCSQLVLGSEFNNWNTTLRVGDNTTITNRILTRDSSIGQGTQTIENVSGHAEVSGELWIDYAPTMPGDELVLAGSGDSFDFSGGWNLCGTQRGVRVLGNVEVSGALTNGYTDGNTYRGLVKRGDGTLKLDGILGVRFYQDEGDVVVGSNCTFAGVDTYYLGTRDNDDYTAGDTFLTFRDAQTFGNGIVVGTLGASPGTRQINFQNTQGLVKVTGSIVLGTNENQYLILSNDTANAELSGEISGSGGLIKQGAGTVIFSANATYSSKTTVSEGALLLNTITNDADVEINSGARLVGRGAVGNLDISGRIGPGTTNAVGTLGCTNLQVRDGAQLDVSMSAAGNSSLDILGDGDVTFDADSTITIVLTNFGGGSLFQNMKLIDYTGGTSVGSPSWVLTGDIPEAMEPYISVTNEGQSYWYIKGANPDCSISTGVIALADGDQVHIAAATVSGMEYDLIYVDAANYSDSLSNQWQYAMTLSASSSTTFFTNSLDGLAAGHHRFFRISPLGAWSNDSGKYASAEIFVAKKITLYPGRNWVAMPCLPPGATMSNVFGYHLPGGASQVSATTVYLYNSETNIAPTNTLWLQAGNHWIEDGSPADTKQLSSVQGMVVDLPGSSAVSFTMIGALRTNAQSAVVQGGGKISLVGAVLPGAMHPKDLGLLASGFTGGYRAMRSDRIYLWDRTTQQIKDQCWMWYNTTLSKWCYNDNTVLSDTEKPCGSDDAILINTQASTENWTWSIPVYYSTPTRQMTP